LLNLTVFKITQGRYDLYITIMKALELLRFAKIDHWVSDNLQGYQRPLNEGRVSKAMNYLLYEEGNFPTSVLINVRGKVYYSPSNMIGDFGELGVLEVPDSALPLWVIDGQHRLAAIERATSKNPRFENFGVPVSIFNFHDRFDEMRQFYIVNNRQKSVSTDLAQRHLHQTIVERGEWGVAPFESEKKILAAEALDIVDLLRTTPDSPWFDNVQLPDSKRGIIKQTSLADAIGYVLKELTPTERHDVSQKPETLATVLIDYWNALKDIFPDAFANPQEYTIQKTTGCYVFHMVFPNILSICKELGDSSEDKMKEILTVMLNNFAEAEGIPMDCSFWHCRFGNPLAMGTNQKTIRLLTYKLLSALNLGPEGSEAI